MSPAPIGALAPATAPIAAPATRPVGPSFGAVLEAHASHQAPRPAPSPVSHSAAVRGLESIERAQARLDGLLAAARSGRTFTPQELVALQGDAYRFGQTVELAAKLVEQGAQAVKQALHAQV
jgi:hypothetical protein